MILKLIFSVLAMTRLFFYDTNPSLAAHTLATVSFSGRGLTLGAVPARPPEPPTAPSQLGGGTRQAGSGLLRGSDTELSATMLGVLAGPGRTTLGAAC